MISRGKAKDFVEDYSDQELKKFILNRLKEENITDTTFSQPEDPEDIVIRLLQNENLVGARRGIILKACEEVFENFMDSLTEKKNVLAPQWNKAIINLGKVINVCAPPELQNDVCSMLYWIIDKNDIAKDKLRSVIKAFIGYSPTPENKQLWVKLFDVLPSLSAYIFQSLLENDPNNIIAKKAIKRLWINVLEQDLNIDVLYLTEKAYRLRTDKKTFIKTVFSDLKEKLSGEKWQKIEELLKNGSELSQNWVRWLTEARNEFRTESIQTTSIPTGERLQGRRLNYESIFGGPITEFITLDSDDRVERSNAVKELRPSPSNVKLWDESQPYAKSGENLEFVKIR